MKVFLSRAELGFVGVPFCVASSYSIVTASRQNIQQVRFTSGYYSENRISLRDGGCPAIKRSRFSGNFWRQRRNSPIFVLLLTFVSYLHSIPDIIKLKRPNSLLSQCLPQGSEEASVLLFRIRLLFSVHFVMVVWLSDHVAHRVLAVPRPHCTISPDATSGSPNVS